MSHDYIHRNYGKFKPKILAAFAKLRKQGIRARANFMCCGSCAAAGLDIKGKKGGVYWHQQDEERFREDGYVYLGFCSRTDEEALLVGKALDLALQAEGLPVYWGESVHLRVRVGDKEEKE